MKKLASLLLGIVALAGTTFAQGRMQSKKDGKAPAAEVVKQAPANKMEAKTMGVPMKKDGTPDKRFKAGKGTKAALGPVKKDGTPDMRFKKNQPAAKKP